LELTTALASNYNGHYSIWLTNELQEKLIFLQDMLINPPLITNWVNGNLYQKTAEVSGVLPIPEDIRLKSGMSTFNPSIDSKQPHHFLAAAQGNTKTSSAYTHIRRKNTLQAVNAH
jgi:hypothetical protein